MEHSKISRFFKLYVAMVLCGLAAGITIKIISLVIVHVVVPIAIPIAAWFVIAYIFLQIWGPKKENSKEKEK